MHCARGPHPICVQGQSQVLLFSNDEFIVYQTLRRVLPLEMPRCISPALQHVLH